MRIDDEVLVAFADGELDAGTHAEVARALAEQPDLRARLERQQRLRDKISAHYGPVTYEAVPERLSALITGDSAYVSGNVIDLAEVRQRSARPTWQNFGAIAATLVVGLLAGQLLPFGRSEPFALEDGAMMARGELAEALETRLASAQAPDAQTRIGLSFETADGRMCRTFDAAALSGLACRGEPGWQLVMTAAADRGGSQYRQAGSDNYLVLQAAQEMIAGEPLGAEAERQARDRGWRKPARAD